MLAKPRSLEDAISCYLLVASIMMSRLPAIALGYNVYQGLQHMGKDPKCMVRKLNHNLHFIYLFEIARAYSQIQTYTKVGWENEVKWRFFAPVLAVVSLALLLMLIVLCNLATPAIRWLQQWWCIAIWTFLVIRKSSILEEVGSVCNGMVGIVVYFTLTWAFAPLAYIRFPDIALPDFYPCFQVSFASSIWSLNSSSIAGSSGAKLLHGCHHLCLAGPGLHQVIPYISPIFLFCYSDPFLLTWLTTMTIWIFILHQVPCRLSWDCYESGNSSFPHLRVKWKQNISVDVSLKLMLI